MKELVLECTYIQGYLKNGYLSYTLTDEEYEGFKQLSLEERLETIVDCGNLKILNYQVEDFETENYFKVYDYKG